MKIAGRIFRANKIDEYTDKSFKAWYKKRRIVVYIVQEYDRSENPLFFVHVSCPNNINTVSHNVKRCTLNDAIIYALNQANL